MSGGGEERPRLALAFDYGTRVIGVACGDTLTRRATPRAAVRSVGGAPDWRAIGARVADLRPDVLVVGAPCNADATASAMTRTARAFAEELAIRFALPVEEVDERWSTLEASADLRDQRASGARRRRVSREDVDSAAAAVILARWFGGEGRPVAVAAPPPPGAVAQR